MDPIDRPAESGGGKTYERERERENVFQQVYNIYIYLSLTPVTISLAATTNLTGCCCTG
jgi:hypothetical protein